MFSIQGTPASNNCYVLLTIFIKIFNDDLETSEVFLDISKTFDKVWHEGLLYKLKQNGTSGNLVNIITDFLSLRKQRAVLNGQHSTWVSIKAGVPQGSILEPLFFLIYINNLSNDLTLNPNYLRLILLSSLLFKILTQQEPI